MNITDELREYADGCFAGPRSAILAIADRIDEEHERKVGCTAAEWDYWDSTHVELPKDADGEYIRIGDVMDSSVDYLFDGKPFTVRAIVLCEDGWEAADGRFGNRYEPDSLHHHHAPTVEDVLEDFYRTAKANSDANMGDLYETIAEYAAKLRLVEGKDA